MNIDRKALLAALTAVNPGLAKRDIIEQSMDFLFTEGLVSTYNDEITVSHPVKGINFTGAVPGDELRKILEKTKDIYIDLEVGKELLITGEKFKASIRMESEVKLPINTTKINEFKLLPDNFKDALKLCIFSAGKQIAKSILTCLHINGNLVESCDNYRVTRTTLSGKVDNMLLPAKAAQHLIRYSIESYAINEGWVHFKTKNDCIFSCRTFSGEYPDLTPIVTFGECHELKFPKDMDEILERATIALSDTISEVNITINEGTATIKSEGEVVRYEETTRMRSKAAIKFSINPDFLRQILAKNSDASISNDFSKMKFFGDSFDHIIAL